MKTLKIVKDAKEVIPAIAEPKIDPEFQNFISPLTPEEFEGLEKSILADGQREPGVIWKGKGILVDGHHKQAICSKHKLKFKIVEKAFKDRNDVMGWMADNQFNRRNLPHYIRGVLALKLKPLIEAEAREKQKTGGEKKVSQNSGSPIHTQKILAKRAKISHDTLNKVEKIEQCATEEVKEKLKAGTIKVHTAYKPIKMAEDEQKRKKATEFGKNKELPDTIKVLQGGLFDAIRKIPDDSVDLFITETPFLSHYANLCDVCNKKSVLEYMERWSKEVISKVKDSGRIKFAAEKKSAWNYQKTVETCTQNGDTVLVCLDDAGATGIACRKLNRKCIMIENSQEKIHLIKGKICSMDEKKSK